MVSCHTVHPRKADPHPINQEGLLCNKTLLNNRPDLKNLPQSMETSKGHMHQTRKILKFTKTQELKTTEEEPMKPLVKRTNIVFTKITDHKQQIATDLTGKLSVTSNRSNKYLFVLYDYDSKFILIRPMKSRPDSKFIKYLQTSMSTYSPGGSNQNKCD